MVPWDPNITRIPQYQHRFGMIEESPNALHAFLGKTWDIFFWSWDIKYLLKLNHPSKPNIGNFTSVELVPKKSCTSLRSRPSSGLDPSGECTPWRKGFLEQPFLRKKKRFCQPPYPGKLFVWVSRSLAPGDQRQPQGNMTLGGSDGDFHVLYSIFLLGKSQTGNQLQIHNRVSQRVSAIIYIYIAIIYNCMVPYV